MRAIAPSLLLLMLAACSWIAPRQAATPPADAPIAPAAAASVPAPNDPAPVVLTYAGRIRQAIRSNIAFPAERLKSAEMLANPAAEVDVRTAPDGKITRARVSKSSGVRDWDAAVLRAVERTKVLPKDADGKVPPRLQIVFRPY